MDEERRERFRAWLKSKFGDERGWQARAVEYAAKNAHNERALDKSFLSQVLTKKVAFGEDAAIAMARRFGLPDDAFLGESSAAEPPFSPEVAHYARLIDDILANHPDPVQRRFTYIMMTLAPTQAPRSKESQERMIEKAIKLIQESQPS